MYPNSKQIVEQETKMWWQKKVWYFISSAHITLMCFGMFIQQKTF